MARRTSSSAWPDISSTPRRRLRSSSEAILRGAGAQSGLWAQGISGDLPILLLRIANADDIRIAHQLLQAMEYWRDQRLAVDLVIVNERASSYIQDLQNALEALVRTSPARPLVARSQDQRWACVRPPSRFDPAGNPRAAWHRSRGSCSSPSKAVWPNSSTASPRPAIAVPTGRKPRAQPAPRPMATPRPQLEYFNGLGGFADDGKEYVTILGPGQSTPAPWINVSPIPLSAFKCPPREAASPGRSTAVNIS